MQLNPYEVISWVSKQKDPECPDAYYLLCGDHMLYPIHGTIDELCYWIPRMSVSLPYGRYTLVKVADKAGPSVTFEKPEPISPKEEPKRRWWRLGQ